MTTDAGGPCRQGPLSLPLDTRLALDLALTVRHDGGIADDLCDPSGLTTWVRARPDLFPGTDAYRADLTAIPPPQVRAVLPGQ
ncbi:hypothetical protein [Streptomyces sp. YKOK-I1]